MNIRRGKLGRKVGRNMKEEKENFEEEEERDEEEEGLDVSNQMWGK